MLKKLLAIKAELSPNLSRIVANLLWLFIDKFLQLGLSLTVGIWLARYLEPTLYGTYNYALAFIAILMPIASMGVSQITVRDLSKSVDEQKEILGTAFFLRVIGSIFCIAIINTLIQLGGWVDSQSKWLILVMSLGLLFSPFEVINYWFQSQVKSKNVVIAKRLAYVCVAISRVILILLKAPLIAFAGVYALELLLGAVALWCAYRIQGNNVTSWSVKPSKIYPMLKEGTPLIFAGLTVYIYSKIDQVMLGSLIVDQSQLAFYSISVRLSETFDFLPGILASSVLPRFTQLKAEGFSYTEKLQVYFDVMTLMWLAFALPVSLFSRPIIHILYGDLYFPAVPMLQAYVWAQFGTCFGIARSTFLTVERKLHYSFYISLLGAAVNILLNYILIPRYQAFGAIIATLTTYFVVTVLLNVFVQDLRKIALNIVCSFNFFASIPRIKKVFVHDRN